MYINTKDIETNQLVCLEEAIIVPNFFWKSLDHSLTVTRKTLTLMRRKVADTAISSTSLRKTLTLTRRKMTEAAISSTSLRKTLTLPRREMAEAAMSSTSLRRTLTRPASTMTASRWKLTSTRVVLTSLYVRSTCLWKMLTFHIKHNSIKPTKPAKIRRFINKIYLI